MIIQNETNLHDFSELCFETTGAVFSLTKNKTREWKINLVNIGVSFQDKNLQECINEAKEYIIKNRKPIEREIKYTLHEK